VSAASRFVDLTPALRPQLETLAREYLAESGETFDAGRHGRAIDMLIAGDPVGRGWLIEMDGRVQGYIVVCLGFSVEYGGYDSFIDEFYVRPAFRRQGLGRAALAHAERYLRDHGVRTIHLEVDRRNDAARGLYRRLGFVDHARLLMSKDLS
jgi:ribosomal protein S18 acetylase RimI-like enzyme